MKSVSKNNNPFDSSRAIMSSVARRAAKRQKWSMPVEAGKDVWLTASADEATALQRPAPNDALRIVATGEKSDRPPVDK